MALDEPKENDSVFDVNGFQFIMEKEFCEKAQPVKIDFLGYGFKIDSSIEFDAGASTCGSCSTTGTCSE
jgi:iron-sulfur cluster assembly protein